MNTLFINACVRDESRTRKLAEHLISKLDGDIIRLDLADEGICYLNMERLERRDMALKKKDLSNDILKYATQFANADKIVIAAPYWDLSFPALLKIYLENVCVVGVTFDYDITGRPFGKCKANQLYYVTTAGGMITEPLFGYGYVKALCNSFYGINNTKMISAQGLDIVGADIDLIMKKAFSEIDEMF